MSEPHSDDLRLEADAEAAGESVAIVGMALRVPGARDVDSFWENLRRGVESVAPLVTEALRAAGEDDRSLGDPDYVSRAATLEGYDCFDAPFFDFSPGEGSILDPQIRHFLECCHEALEHAGCDPRRHPGAIGVFAGAGMNTYLMLNLQPNPAVVDTFGWMALRLSNDNDFLTTLVSYKLDLKGPSVNLQTACSTSLVAVHMARESLLSGQCDLALAGAVTILVPHGRGYLWQEGSILSPDGRCRAFDAAAAGTVSGSGVGVVVLKRLDEALADGDTIHAVLRGSAINNDGALKVGYTAPSATGQAEAIATALGVAGVDPRSVGYVEAHGTGTKMGDPVEVEGLSRAFRLSTDDVGFCALGSVKTNVGHLDTAAGVTGLIKATLAVKHGEIPPSLHFENPNPAIDFASTPFYVADRLVPWPGGDGRGPRRAGVSSFGIGGTNAHAIVEQPPRQAAGSPGRPRQLLLLSAKSRDALDAATERLAGHLAAQRELEPADVAFTLALGRRQMPHRRALVATDLEDAVAGLADPRRLATAVVAETPAVVFLFPGQGSQYPAMARDLHAAEPVFRDALDRCIAILRERVGLDLGAALHPQDPRSGAAAADLTATEVAQPALFAVEWSLAELWRHWGVRPEAMLGHSVGELVAATCAGTLALEDALELVAVRGRLMQAMEGGAMVAVPHDEAAVEALLREAPAGLELAAVNAPALCVVAGPVAAVDAFAAQLEAAGVDARRLHVSHAFHTAMMEPMLGALRRVCARLRPALPKVPWISNVSGTWITREQAMDPGYWVDHARVAVRFADGVRTLLAEPRLYLEVGPGHTLADLVRRNRRSSESETSPPPVALASLPGPKDAEHELDCLYRTVGRLWLSGVEVDHAAFFAGQQRRRVSLPTYPFEQRRLWIDPSPLTGRAAAGPAAHLEALRPAPAPDPAPEPGPGADPRAHLLSAYAAPQSALERALSELWSDMLGVPLIGIDDGFFELGGHSLLAAQLAGRIGERFGVRLATAQLLAAPTIAQLAASVEQLGYRDDETPAEHTGSIDGLAPVVPDPDSRHLPFPLTDVQQAYWIGRMEAVDLGAVATHAYFEIDAGALDTRRLEHAWQRVIERHGMLRAIVEEGGRQRILRPEELPAFALRLNDLREATVAEVARRLAATRAVLSHKVQPADQWPLFDVEVSLLPGGAARVHLGIDLLIADGWSFSVLNRELGLFYRRPDAELLPLSLSFRDCVMAEVARAESELFARSLAYWRERLPSLPPAPELPVLPIDRASTFVRREMVLESGAWSRLKQRAGRAGISHSGALLAAFSQVLALWSKRQHMTLNLTLFNRLPLHPQVEELIGDFTSLTLLEVDLRQARPFEERARRLQEQLWRDLDHRHVSGVRVMRELARAAGRAAGVQMPVVFTSMLGIGTAGEVPEAVFGVPGEIVFTITQTPQVWLDHQVAETPAGDLMLVWDAVEDLFPEGVLDSMFDAYRVLLRRLADDGESWRATSFDLLPGSEVRRLAAVNATAGPIPEGLLHAPILRRATEHPEALAVVDARGRLSYRRLVSIGHRLGRALRQRGARRNTVVAVVLTKGRLQAAAILGVLVSGAAYLPIDPAQPAERLAYLLAEGRVEVLVTDSACEHSLAWPPHVDRVVIDDFDDEDAALAEPPDAIARAEDLAYVIFTSGSTGRPKGVMIEHRAALNTCIDVNRRFEIGRGDKVLAISALHFDLSVWDFFGVLGAGGTVVMPDPAGVWEPEHWLALLEEHGVTVWNSVPALVQMLVDYAVGTGRSLPSSLRLCMMSGDWIPVSLPDRLRQLVPGIEVISLGGATEASIWSILHPIETVDPSWKSIPYGRPMTNQHFHVLSQSAALEARPTWVAGDLYIGGIGLAAGYWRDEEKTRAAFIRHPQSGERLYRTGDLGRWLPSGEIEFLGREDTQVKVQGHRIELGEIEAALARVPGVAQAVVVAVGERHGSKRLVGYVVATDDVASEDLPERMPKRLRVALSDRLPAYMVPTTILMLDALPLSANGKVRRDALPSPEAADHAGDPVESQPVEALTPLEATLAAAWAEVLQRPARASDGFFDLGGDSVLAVRVVVRLRSVLPVEVGLGDFFATPTLSALAQVLEARMLKRIESMSDEEVQAHLV